MEINKRTEEGSERTRYRFPRCTAEALYNNPGASRDSIEIISLKQKKKKKEKRMVEFIDRGL